MFHDCQDCSRCVGMGSPSSRSMSSRLSQWLDLKPLLPPVHKFTNLSRMDWCPEMRATFDRGYCKIAYKLHLPLERCHPWRSRLSQLPPPPPSPSGRHHARTHVLFVVAACVREGDGANARHLRETLASVRSFHKENDVLLVHNCHFNASDHHGLAGEHIIASSPKDLAAAAGAQASHASGRIFIRAKERSEYEMGAFADGVALMTSSGKYKSLVLLQHTTPLAGPISHALQHARCPTLLHSPLQFLGGHWASASYLPTSMYLALEARGIDVSWVGAYTRTWISATHGVLMIDSKSAALLQSQRLLDADLVRLCARKWCWESLSGLYACWLNSAQESNCRGLQVHPLTLKRHGST